MFEVYGFLAMFTAQIVVLTVLYPLRLIGRVRTLLARYPADRFPQIYPADAAGVERQLRRYRLLNAVVAVIGVALLGWFFNYMQRPDWDDGPIESLLGVFFMLQLMPVLTFIWAAERWNRRLRSLLKGEPRKAVLEPRGLFDFVSPLVVFVTLSCYPLFVGYVLYIGQDPFPGFAGVYVNVGIVTAMYAAFAIAIYMLLYGKKAHPLQTHADRMRTIEVAVKVCVYSCLVLVVFLSLNFTLVLLDLQRWEPLGQSVAGVTLALLYLKGMYVPASELNLDRLPPSAQAS